MNKKLNKVIISGGGTGGHIFPAIAIANEIKSRNPDVEILFVGALGKMEMEKVPLSGYNIIGLPIVGFQRKFTFSNFWLPFKIIKSLWMAIQVVKKFKPQVVVGVGGFASGPTLKAAIFLKIPTLIQEQNSFAGKTNKILSKKVNKICTAYTSMDTFFPKDKIVLTGNPVRKEMVDISNKKEDAIRFFGLDFSKKTILFIGGSLGAKTLNESILQNLDWISQQNFQILWQSGSYYFPNIKDNKKIKDIKNLHLQEFIYRMDLAYSVADIIISRAGAIAVSELCLVKKPTILVPSPNVAEDHQTKNAMALVSEDAALLVKDKDAINQLPVSIQKLLTDEQLCEKLSNNITKLARKNATEHIVNEIEKIISENNEV